MKKIVRFFCLTLLLMPMMAFGQQHFSWTDNTGNNATVGVLLSTEVSVNGSGLQSGDEIGVFTPDGLCVGGIVWEGNKNQALTVWGNNSMTNQKDGINAGETMHFRIWLQEENTEYEIETVEYLSGTGIYEVNGIYVLSSLITLSPPEVPALINPDNNAEAIDTEVLFSWQQADRADSYILEVGLDNSFGIGVNEHQTEETQITVNLDFSSRYYWRVRSVNNAGASDWSETRVLTTIKDVPSVPVPTSPANNASNIALSVELSWEEADSADTYILQISTASNFQSSLIQIFDIQGTAYIVEGLEINRRYYWRVSAVNIAGNSGWSGERTFTTITELPSAGKPEMPELHSPQNNAMNVSTSPSLVWKRAERAEKYTLQILTLINNQSEVITISDIEDTSYTVSGLNNSKDYYWRVRSVNSSGTSEWTENRKFTTTSGAPVLVPPSVPVLMTPANEATGITTTVELAWQASQGADKYSLQVSSASGFSSTVVNVTNIGSTVYTVAGLQSDRTYFWRVSAQNSDGTSGWSQTWRFTTEPSVNMAEVQLNAGWNMISLNVNPETSKITDIFSGINDPQLFVKNVDGQAYWPAYDIYDLNEWNISEGYEVYVSEPHTLRVYGTKICPVSTKIALSGGWNIVPYYLDVPLPISTAFNCIIDKILIVKDKNGNAFWPEYDVDQIGYLNPGEGYHVYLLSEADIVYSIDTAARVQASAQNTQSVNSEHKPARYLTEHTNTGSNAVILIKSPQMKDMDEIGIWNAGGLLVGSGVVSNGRAVVTVWGDNVATRDVVDGAQENELLRLTLWSAITRIEREVEVKDVINILYPDRENNGLRYQENGLFVVTADFRAGDENGNIITDYQLYQNFPNPFNPSTQIQFRVSDTQYVRIAVYSMTGQQIRVLADDIYEAGTHIVDFNAENISSGTYFYRIYAGRFTETRPMILMR